MDYTNRLAYSAKVRNARKNGKLIYYRVVSFDGKNIIVEQLKHLPMEQSIPYGAGNNRRCWDVLNLDILAETYKVIVIGKEDETNEN